ncbi:MAG: hypothetical protein PUF51_03745, partial [Bifidobacteriaceae bacterium]|nr:hypothetical protein [Bifidobacteriaceae bacterium]
MSARPRPPALAHRFATHSALYFTESALADYRNEYSEQKGKSLFDGTLDEAQQCILDHAGTGTFIGNKEYVDCGKEIGIAR